MYKTMLDVFPFNSDHRFMNFNGICSWWGWQYIHNLNVHATLWILASRKINSADWVVNKLILWSTFFLVWRSRLPGSRCVWLEILQHHIFVSVETDCDDRNKYFLKMLTKSSTSGCSQFHQDWLPHCKSSSISHLLLLLVLPELALLLPVPMVPISGYLQFHQNWFIHCRSFKSLPPEATHG